MNPLDALTSNPTVAAGLAAVLLACIGAVTGLWLAAAWWTYGDLSRRVPQEPIRLLGPAWIVASTPVLLPLSIAAYLLVRPQETLAERRSREILNALVPSRAESCPGCAERIDDGWRRCPSCAAWLSAPCSHCGRWSTMNLDLCPFCATERSVAPAETPPGLVPVRLPIAEVVTEPLGSAAEPEPAPDTPAEPSPRRRAGPAAGPWASRPANRGARDGHRAGRAASASGPPLARVGR